MPYTDHRLEEKDKEMAELKEVVKAKESVIYDKDLLLKKFEERVHLLEHEVNTMCLERGMERRY